MAVRMILFKMLKSETRFGGNGARIPEVTRSLRVREEEGVNRRFGDSKIEYCINKDKLNQI